MLGEFHTAVRASFPHDDGPRVVVVVVVVESEKK